jgi:hypothetical protein
VVEMKTRILLDWYAIFIICQNQKKKNKLRSACENGLRSNKSIKTVKKQAPESDKNQLKEVVNDYFCSINEMK